MVRSGNPREKDIGYMKVFGTKQHTENVRDFLSRPERTEPIFVQLKNTRILSAKIDLDANIYGLTS